MSELKDSGSTREFETGAHRDSAKGKARVTIVPLNVAAKLLNDKVIMEIYHFTKTNDTEHLYNAIRYSTNYIPEHTDLETIVLEVAYHYEDGALKYGLDNWRNGMHLDIYLNSALRHYLKARRGDKDEPHYRGFTWNLMSAIETYENGPEQFKGVPYKVYLEL